MRTRGFFQSTVVCAIFVCLSACTLTKEYTALVDETIIDDVKESFPQIDESIFGQRIESESVDEIFTLAPYQKRRFLSYYNDPVRTSLPGHQRLANFIEDVGLIFEYSNETYNATKTLSTATGNCMSLAILTSSLAHTAGIQIAYQLVDRIPIYEEYGGLIFSAQHIRSIIYKPSSNEGESVVRNRLSERARAFNRGQKKLIVDYYPSRNNYASAYVTEKQVLGFYYRNLAAEALARKEFEKSYWLLRSSLDIEPDNAQAINSMAVLFRRFGDSKTSEELYKYGIKTANNKVVLLKNYRIYLNLEGRSQDAAKVSKELEDTKDKNPFRWLHAANELYKENDPLGAIELYKRAIRLAPYLHQGHFGIAKAHYAVGNFSAAKKSLKKAQKEALDRNSRSLYGAKLAALSYERSHANN